MHCCAGRTLAVRAVDGVSFSVTKGENARARWRERLWQDDNRALRPVPATTDLGEVIVNGQRVDPRDEAAMRRRRKQLQIVFQDPNSSLNPRMTVGQTLGEALAFHQMVQRRPQSGGQRATRDCRAERPSRGSVSE